MPEVTQPVFGIEAPILAIVFVTILMLIGYYAYRKRIGVSVEDFFLASRVLGYIVLGLSIYAAQYSGNSFIGYAARGYRTGFIYLVYPTFMLSILPVMILVASKLIPISVKNKLVSPLDFLRLRYGYASKSLLNVLIALCLIFLIWGTFVQFFEQAIAMGYLGEVVSAGIVPYMAMVIIFVIGVIIFVILGGFRGAALANCIMGAMMLIGLASTLFLIFKDFGSLGDAVIKLSQTTPTLISTPSSVTGITEWFSTIFLVGVGAILYIHILQHIIAAKDPKVFKRTFLFTPYFYIFTATALLLIGICGAAAIPGLGTMESERIVPLLIVKAAATDPSARILGLLWMLALLSATLSTAGTTILAISMTLVRDVYKYVKPSASERELILASRIILTIIALLAIPIVIEPRATIWRWTEIKFEGILQAFPPIILGLYVPWINAKGVVGGMVVGALTALTLTLSGYAKIYGVHSGVIGLILNIVICLVISKLTAKPEEIKHATSILE